MYTIEQILDCIEKAKCWKCGKEKGLCLDNPLGGLHSLYKCNSCDSEVYILYDKVKAEPIVLYDSQADEEIEVYDK
jgi:hypothetical protein